MRIVYSISCTLLGVMLSVGTLADAAEKTFEAVDCRHRQTIYHSPQAPGYTCWVHAWTMPDRSVMIGFQQAVGPKDGRPRAPIEVQKKLTVDLADPARDMTGLEQSIVYLRSKNGGVTWKKECETPIRNPTNATVIGTVGLNSGTILRAVFGGYLVYDNLPATGLLQRSADIAHTWDKPTCFISPEQYVAYPANLRRLRDGRAILVGGVSHVPSGRPFPEWYKGMEPLLLVSNDDGKTWGEPIRVVPEKVGKTWACEECDAAELPSGDLFWVFRRAVPEDADKPAFQRRHTYWQGVVEKDGDTWKPKWAAPSPFPNLGLPNLLATRQGPIVLINAGKWTNDAGKNWHSIKNYPAGIASTRAYYPKAVQLADGRILVFAHVGSDDAYGVVDQSIVMDSFTLKMK